LAHTIVEHSIGSTTPRRISQPYYDATYVLSAQNGGSATSVRYTSTECVPPEERNKFANEEERRLGTAKQRLAEWLETAADDARAVAQERTEKPSAPAPTMMPSPEAPTASATPIVSPPVGVP
jgi:hypothetical protein